MAQSPGTLTKRRPTLRGTAAQRGYDYRWQQLSKRMRSETPLCVLCERAGRVVPATQVHHVESVVDAPHKRLDANNTMPLCASCHRRVEAGLESLPMGEA